MVLAAASTETFRNRARSISSPFCNWPNVVAKPWPPPVARNGILRIEASLTFVHVHVSKIIFQRSSSISHTIFCTSDSRAGLIDATYVGASCTVQRCVVSVSHSGSEGKKIWVPGERPKDGDFSCATRLERSKAAVT